MFLCTACPHPEQSSFEDLRTISHHIERRHLDKVWIEKDPTLSVWDVADRIRLYIGSGSVWL